MLVKINEKVLANNNLLLSNIKQEGWRKMQKIHQQKANVKRRFKTAEREKERAKEAREKNTR